MKTPQDCCHKETQMSLPSLTKRLVEEQLSVYCEARVPEHVKDQVRLTFKIRGNSVTLFEQRPSFPAREIWVDILVAQFRYDQKENQWTLYWADRNGKWHKYDGVKPDLNFEDLLTKLEEDPDHVFWG
jgi:frataxin-like iron-binding protein CyaY